MCCANNPCQLHGLVLKNRKRSGVALARRSAHVIQGWETCCVVSPGDWVHGPCRPSAETRAYTGCGAKRERNVNGFLPLTGKEEEDTMKKFLSVALIACLFLALALSSASAVNEFDLVFKTMAELEATGVNWIPTEGYGAEPTCSEPAVFHAIMDSAKVKELGLKEGTLAKIENMPGYFMVQAQVKALGHQFEKVTIIPGYDTQECYEVYACTRKDEYGDYVHGENAKTIGKGAILRPWNSTHKSWESDLTQGVEWVSGTVLTKLNKVNVSTSDWLVDTQTASTVAPSVNKKGSVVKFESVAFLMEVYYKVIDAPGHSWAKVTAKNAEDDPYAVGGAKYADLEDLVDAGWVKEGKLVDRANGEVVSYFPGTCVNGEYGLYYCTNGANCNAQNTNATDKDGQTIADGIPGVAYKITKTTLNYSNGVDGYDAIYLKEDGTATGLASTDVTFASWSGSKVPENHDVYAEFLEMNASTCETPGFALSCAPGARTPTMRCLIMPLIP